jgi:hypothetical protein
MALKKGFLPLTILLGGIIFTVTVAIGSVLALLFVKYHITINLKFEYEKSFSDLTMLSLLRLNYNKTYSAYRILSEREINGFDDDMKKFISNKTGLLADTDCFYITNKTSYIFDIGCGPSEHVGESFIFKPYNPNNLVEEIALTYNKVKR